RRLTLVLPKLRAAVERLALHVAVRVPGLERLQELLGLRRARPCELRGELDHVLALDVVPREDVQRLAAGPRAAAVPDDPEKRDLGAARARGGLRDLVELREELVRLRVFLPVEAHLLVVGLRVLELLEEGVLLRLELLLDGGDLVFDALRARF